MPPRTVRHKILERLVSHPDLTAGEIAQSLGLGAPSARHHLAILTADGRVVIAGQRPGRGRGRPRKVYRVSDRLRGDNLAGLVDSLFEASLPGPPGDDPDAAARLAQGMVRRLGPLDPRASGARRLAALVAKLNALHYESSWEAGASGPRVLFGHCPYAAVIERHPELCQMDTLIIASELGTEAAQTAKIDAKPAGQAHCIFALK